MSPRLSQQELERLPAEVAVPRYDRARTGVGIVHLGVGAFHRAHQAWYTEQALNGDGGDWAIVGASLRSARIRDRLRPQDGLFTLVERAGDECRYQVIGAVQSVLVGPEDPQALIDQLSRPEIRIVTLTITEKGYLYDRAAGTLQLEHPDIHHDIAHFPRSPLTAVGYLVAALAQRRERGVGGLTLLSCDNLPHNGRILKRVVTDFAQRVDPSLISWIEDNVTFPSSMVDRIVPATTAQDLDQLASVLGIRDEAAVFTEPFSQWVVEADFARGSPDWQNAGALLTDDVTPFETMKLRLLNGSHSLMAYLGYLAGYDYVHQAMADDNLRRLVRRYMDEQAQPTLEVPKGFDIEDYKAQLLRRFANTALNHRLYQIAQDGSQKIPQRWLATVRELSAMGRPTSILALAVAGWLRYLEGRRDNGETFEVDDPLYDTLKRGLDQRARPGGVLKVAAVFGDLAETEPDFVASVVDFYRQLVPGGVAKTVAAALAADGGSRFENHQP